MRTLQLPARQLRICGNAIVWLEVGDWVKTPRPEMALSTEELRDLANRLCGDFWSVVNRAKNPEEFRRLSGALITIELSDKETICISQALDGVLRELDDDPIEMRTVIAGDAGLEFVRETAEYIRRLAAA